MEETQLQFSAVPLLLLSSFWKVFTFLYLYLSKVSEYFIDRYIRRNWSAAKQQNGTLAPSCAHKESDKCRQLFLTRKIKKWAESEEELEKHQQSLMSQDIFSTKNFDVFKCGAGFNWVGFNWL